jgi:hypothetical protein
MSYFQGYLGGCSQLTHIFLYYSRVNSYIIFLYYLYYSAWRCLVPSFHQARRWHHQSQQRCYTAPLQRCKELGPCSQRCSHFTILPSFQYWHPPTSITDMYFSGGTTQKRLSKTNVYANFPWGHMTFCDIFPPCHWALSRWEATRLRFHWMEEFHIHVEANREKNTTELIHPWIFSFFSSFFPTIFRQNHRKSICCDVHSPWWSNMVCWKFPHLL